MTEGSGSRGKRSSRNGADDPNEQPGRTEGEPLGARTHRDGTVGGRAPGRHDGVASITGADTAPLGDFLIRKVSRWSPSSVPTKRLSRPMSLRPQLGARASRSRSLPVLSGARSCRTAPGARDPPDRAPDDRGCLRTAASAPLALRPRPDRPSSSPRKISRSTLTC